MSVFKKELRVNAKITASLSARKESGYLIVSNREKCANLIGGSELSEKDIIDIFISLHIVLEVGLNTLFRHLALMFIKKDIDDFEVIKNIDNISFIDKTILFIYNSKFEFGDEILEATKYHSIIGTLRDFSALRNQLLHGHSISTIFDGQGNRHSNLKKSITLENLDAQIKKFRFILEGMRFYLDHLDSPISSDQRDTFKESFLSDSFLPHLSVLKEI